MQPSSRAVTVFDATQRHARAARPPRRSSPHRVDRCSRPPYLFSRNAFAKSVRLRRARLAAQPALTRVKRDRRRQTHGLSLQVQWCRDVADSAACLISECRADYGRSGTRDWGAPRQPSYRCGRRSPRRPTTARRFQPAPAGHISRILNGCVSRETVAARRSMNVNLVDRGAGCHPVETGFSNRTCPRACARLIGGTPSIRRHVIDKPPRNRAGT